MLHDLPVKDVGHTHAYGVLLGSDMITHTSVTAQTIGVTTTHAKGNCSPEVRTDDFG